MSVHVFFFFFFSSRRRHTRLQGDWSSDVCSSDLPLALASSGPTRLKRRDASNGSGAHSKIASPANCGSAASARSRAATPSCPSSSRTSLVALRGRPDRKSTRLNSSHLVISYAVFCLNKKKQLRHH